MNYGSKFAYRSLTSYESPSSHIDYFASFQWHMFYQLYNYDNKFKIKISRMWRIYVPLGCHASVSPLAQKMKSYLSPDYFKRTCFQGPFSFKS